MNLIDRQNAFEVLTEYYHHTTETQHTALREALDRVPSADAVEVVWCKDCLFGHRWYEIINGVGSSWVECKNPDGLYRDVSIDGYCSVGVRKDD